MGGEIKKSIFTVMNYIMPEKDVMPMHCSANVGKDGDSAIFFGLSGTGKTTLSADPARLLVGDDEHGWSEDGIFNFEGGCYAKIIKLRKGSEPLIYSAIWFGSIAEDVVYNPLNLMVPEEIEVDQRVLIPEHTWQDKMAYKQKMEHLVGLFMKNFERFKAQVDSSVMEAGPNL